MRYFGASVSGHIAAPIEALWEVVSDVSRHHELAGSGHVQKVEVVGADALAQGRLFRAQQNVKGFEYVTVSKVVRWEPPFCFAWRVGVDAAPGVAQIWHFLLRPEAGGTRVENGVTAPYVVPPVWPFVSLRSLFEQAEVSTVRPTLDRLAETVDAPPPTDIMVHLGPPAATAQLMPSTLYHTAAWALGAAALGALAVRRQRAS